MADNIYALNIPPGIQRDGTQFAAQAWTSGTWTRFQRQLPQKIGGYQAIMQTATIARGMYVLPTTPNFNVYLGEYNKLTYATIDQYGNYLGGPVDRTPTLFLADVNNIWQFDVMFSTVNNTSILVAHAAPNLAAIDNNVDRPVYYGIAENTTALIPTGFLVSGGIVVLHPYLFMFGNDGNVIVSNANDPTTQLLNVRVTGQKIVAGLATRGGNSSPAGLLWSLDSVIRVTFVGGTAIFNFDTITNESSILSSNGIIEYDGIYYWAASDRFLAYTGQVLEVPNSYSINWFFRNLNYAQREKVFATKVTQYGEIWWFYPSGNSTENNMALIYNVREKYWYDTPLDRSVAYYDSIFAKPIWTDNQQNSLNNYNVYMHETGYDYVDEHSNVNAINASFTTPYLSLCTTGVDSSRRALDRWTELYRIEPDFIQKGNMSVTVSSRQYANSSVTISNLYTFSPQTEKLDMREDGREIQLTFQSNTVGGYFEMGQVLIVGRIGDARQ